MADMKKFQEMNGCSACKHATSASPDGKLAAAHGKGFWCAALGKAVDTKDGAACPRWVYQG